MRAEIADLAEPGAAGAGQPGPAGTVAAEEMIRRRLEYLQGMDRSPEMAGLDLDAYVEVHAQLLTGVIDRVFDDIPRSETGERGCASSQGF